MLKRENVLLTFFALPRSALSAAVLHASLFFCKVASFVLPMLLVLRLHIFWHWQAIVVVIVVYSCCTYCHIWYCSGAVAFSVYLLEKIFDFCIFLLQVYICIIYILLATLLI